MLVFIIVIALISSFSYEFIYLVPFFMFWSLLIKSQFVKEQKIIEIIKTIICWIIIFFLFWLPVFFYYKGEVVSLFFNKEIFINHGSFWVNLAANKELLTKSIFWQDKNAQVILLINGLLIIFVFIKFVLNKEKNNFNNNLVFFLLLLGGGMIISALKKMYHNIRR